jgi:hypothetical protein
MKNHDWMTQAACRGLDINLFFSERGDQKTLATAMEICNGTNDTPPCPVREECLAWAISHEDDNHGIFGGLTPSARLRLKRGQRKANQLREEQASTQRVEPAKPIRIERKQKHSTPKETSRVVRESLPTDYEWRLGLRQLVRLIHEAVLDDMNQDRARQGIGPVAIQIRP